MKNSILKGATANEKRPVNKDSNSKFLISDDNKKQPQKMPISDSDEGTISVLPKLKKIKRRSIYKI